MTINAYKDGVTPFSEDAMNSLLNLQPFVSIYEGSVFAYKEGVGTAENSVASFCYVTRFTATGVTNISRAVLHLDKDGNGADLIVRIHPDTGGGAIVWDTILKQVIIPKEFVPTMAGLVSIPIDLDVTSGTAYWLAVIKAGDAENKLDWISEATSDASSFRASDPVTPSWEGCNTLHYYLYSGDSGQPVHVIEGENALTTIEYTGGLPSKVYEYIPPSDGSEGGIRDILMVTYSGGLPKRGVSA